MSHSAERIGQYAGIFTGQSGTGGARLPILLSAPPIEAASRFSSIASRYAIAVLTVAAAVAASLASAAFLNVEPFVSLFLCAVMFVTWFGGVGPGLLATVLALLAFDYYLLAPVRSIYVEAQSLPRLGLFGLTALFVNWIVASLQRSRRDLLVVLEDQKRVEASLLRSEMYLAEAQRLSQTGSFGWNIATGELVWSEQTFRILGFDRSITPTIDHLVERVHPNDRAAVRQMADRASGDGKNFDHEYRLLMPDGTVKHVRVLAHAARDALGRVEFIGAITDVTAAKRAEEGLRQSEQRFRDFAETASDWFWETDRHHRLTSLSRESAEVIARIGAAPWKFANDRDEQPEKWQRLLADLDARVSFRDFRFRAHVDGAAIYLSASGRPILDSNGDFLGYRGIATDVTAAVRAEQAEVALRDAQTDLAHATRVITLGELTTSIAHEVNQPLTAILSNAVACLHWLDRGTDHIGAARRSAEWIVKDVSRAADVIRRVRALASKTETERARLDINDVVGEVRSLLRRELSGNGVLLSMELSPCALTVQADRVQLQQVIINLVMNGIEAMQPVTDRSRELLIRSQRTESGDVLLMVRDCGIGFSANTPSGCSRRSFRPSREAWAWVCRSADRSSSLTVAGCRRPGIRIGGRRSSSPCLSNKPTRFGRRRRHHASVNERLPCDREKPGSSREDLSGNPIVNSD